MDEAKVVINIKEGIIELQGPVDFVRRYLDKYQPAIKGMQGLPEEKSITTKTARTSTRKRREIAGAVPLKKKRGSSTKAIKGYLEAGFFDEPRSTGEIKQHLAETGIDCSDSVVRASLARLVKSGSLGCTGKRKTLRYHQPDKQ